MNKAHDKNIIYQIIGQIYPDDNTYVTDNIHVGIPQFTNVHEYFCKGLNNHKFFI